MVIAIAIAVAITVVGVEPVFICAPKILRPRAPLWYPLGKHGGCAPGTCLR
jgi:hypothetical protein